MLHEENEKLNEAEKDSGIDVLESFPPFVGLNMTSVCNARCTFCSIQPITQPIKDFITLEDIKKMTWLKYVKEFAIWCGIGESLVNKEFLACYRYLKNTFPHLNINFSTNGIGMTKEISGEFVGHLDYYNVSLNATNKEEWSEIMRAPAKKFAGVCKGYTYLAKLKKEQKSNRPALKISMVVTRDNLESVVQFADLAKILGAEYVTYVNFVTSTLVGKRDLDKSRSLYYEQDKCDEWLARAKSRAEELGLVVIIPHPFSEKSEIDHGTRVPKSSGACRDPWKTCYLTVNEDGNRQMVFCCSGFYYSIEYDKSQLDEEYFKIIWNHPAATYFRRTVNKGTNPICGFCQTQDHFDPEDNTIFEIGNVIKPVFSRLNDKYKSVGGNVLLEDMVEFV